jgi:hypothetical protein
MSHRQSKLYSELTLSIRNLDREPPCVERYLLYYPEGDEAFVKSCDREAKAVCQTCPVIQKCLDYAISANEPEGVWGGLTVAERELLRLAKKESRLNGQEPHN